METGTWNLVCDQETGAWDMEFELWRTECETWNWRIETWKLKTRFLIQELEVCILEPGSYERKLV